MNNARKAIFAFLGLFATNLATELMKDGNPLPTNWGDAARWIISIALGTAAVYAVRPAKGVNTPPPNTVPAAEPGTPGRPFG